MDNTILKVNHLTKTYGTKTALKDVTFTVKKGKIYGFIGENGAGKTTTIRAITGLTSVAEGSVEIFGALNQKGLEEARKKMGCLVERPILSLNKTAFDNLRMQQLLFGQTDDAKIDAILERVGLGDVRNKKVKDFSLGMKQRLGIALALINSPELLILDEPVNGLDPMGMVDVRKLLRSLCEDDGITILISSHILAELYQLVTDYIIISHGQILETLSKEELDNKCSAYILLEAPETQAALKILTEHDVKLVLNENESINIYDDVSIKDVAKWLFDANILVTLLMKYEKSLENYYMELLGGKS
ncbi:MAG: ATP-binding cassette domain-containing protein [Lachnospiraceae bacterium]|nr:ATP-binding cassette domain-containing protein [Lachnospiraceae bacterium]